MHDVHVDCEPHEEIARLCTIRCWRTVEQAATRPALSARIEREAMCAQIDWRKFDDLKTFVVEYLKEHVASSTKSTGGQIATDTSKNTMILSLLKLLYQLVRGGFFFAFEMENLRSPLLQMLDGRHDRVRCAQAISHHLHMRAERM
eukprot:5291660-Prymnesium_polylepis.1